jgi:hypothetical protein
MSYKASKTTYTVTAGDNSTDLGTVGRAKTLLGAKRIGRAAVRTSLPNGCGGYRVWTADGKQVAGGSRSIRTDYRWQD